MTRLLSPSVVFFLILSWIPAMVNGRGVWSPA